MICIIFIEIMFLTGWHWIENRLLPDIDAVASGFCCASVAVAQITLKYFYNLNTGRFHLCRQENTDSVRAITSFSRNFQYFRFSKSEI